MRLLVLITRYPYPANSGDLIYNAGLIEALDRDPGTALTVYCGEPRPQEAPAPPGGATWHFGASKSRAADLRSLVSAHPRTAQRCHSEADLKQIAALIAAQGFDHVLISEASSGRGLARFRAAAPEKTRFVYVAHNVDTLVRIEAAREMRSPVLRPLVMMDGRKGARLEQRVLRDCDCMTAISPEDLVEFDQLAPDLPKLVLRPAYSGTRRTERNIDATSTRCAVLVGSFNWYVKQVNLLELVEAHAKARDKGAVDFGLRIAGRMPPKLAQYLTQRYPHLDLRPSFERLEDVLHDARVAVVLERLGSGFKLKILDYIFARVPIIAYANAMAGSDLQPGTGFLAMKTMQEAMAGIQGVIDDFATLNGLQNAAFARASDLYDWDARREALLAFLGDGGAVSRTHTGTHDEA